MQTSKKNAGVTLIELIVVIAILAVITSGVVVFTGIGKWADASAAANRIDAKMEQVKTLAMSKKDNVYLALYKKDDGYYISATNNISPFTPNTGDEEKVGSNQMSITVTFEDKSEQAIEGSYLFLTFDRASGAFLPCQISSDGAIVQEAKVPERITVTAKGRTNTIRTIAQTGKHYIE